VLQPLPGLAEGQGRKSEGIRRLSSATFLRTLATLRERLLPGELSMAEVNY